MVDLQGAQLDRCGLVLKTVCNCCRSHLLLPRLVWGSRSFGWEGIFLPVSKWWMEAAHLRCFWNESIHRNTKHLGLCVFHHSWALSWSCFLFRASSCQQWVTAFLLSQPFLNILILRCCVLHLKVLLTQFALTLDRIDTEVDVKSAAVFRGASVMSPPVSSARLSELRQRCSKSCPARRGVGF